MQAIRIIHFVGLFTIFVLSIPSVSFTNHMYIRHCALPIHASSKLSVATVAYKESKKSAKDIELKESIVNLVLHFGEDWELIANQVFVKPSRCKSIYNKLKKATGNDPWTSRDDAKLLKLCEENERILTPKSLVEASSSRKQFELVRERGALLHFAGWRNVSYYLNRTSIACRRRYNQLKSNSMESIDQSVDFWSNWEILQLALMIKLRGTCYADFGRHLGRTPMQCYNCVNSKQYNSIAERLQVENARNDSESFGGSQVDFNIPLSIKSVTLTLDDIDDSATLSTNSSNLDSGQESTNSRKENILQSPNLAIHQQDFGSQNKQERLRGHTNHRWTATEDQHLLDLVEKYGRQWKKVSRELLRQFNVSILHGACCGRYHILSTNVPESSFPNKYAGIFQATQHWNSTSVFRTSRKWTPEMRAVLEQLVNEHGAAWTDIAAVLGPGYNRYGIRGVYKTMCENEPDRLALPRRQRITSDSAFMLTKNPSNMSNFNTSTSTRHPLQWTPAQDRLLGDLVSRYGTDWAVLAELLARSPEDVMMRHDFKLEGGRKGRWTRLEDNRLREHVQRRGTSDWSDIAAALGRSRAQCSLRWRVSLDPRLQWKVWSEAEDERLFHLRQEMGYNWVMISAAMDRPSSACRHRFITLLSKMNTT